MSTLWYLQYFSVEFREWRNSVQVSYSLPKLGAEMAYRIHSQPQGEDFLESTIYDVK